jgi:hypothetical protein
LTATIDGTPVVGTRAALRSFHSATVGSQRPPLRLWGLVALLVAISISPRIELPIQIPARAFDLRFEDLVLLVLVPVWVVWLVRKRRLPASLKTIALAFALYLAIALVSSALAIVLGGLSPTRSLAYWAKELEYLMILVISATWIQGALERRFLGLWLIALGVANAAWVGVQLLMGHTSTLLHFPNAPGAYQRPHLLESYGPGLIGEVSPLSAGAFFMVVFLVVFAAFALAATRNARLRWLALSVLFLVPNFLSQSRVTMAGCALGAGVLALYTRHFRRIAIGFLSVAAVALLASYLTGGISTGRLTGLNNIEHSILYRLNISWAPLLGQKPAPTSTVTAAPVKSTERSFPGRTVEVAVLGHGSGAMGAPGVLPTEAHDQYLRVFLESGALGLAAFLLLIGLTARRLFVTIRQLGQPSDQRRFMDKTIAIAALATVIAFLFGATVQDMFLPVLPNELLWFVVGMALSIAAVRDQPRPLAAAEVSAVA